MVVLEIRRYSALENLAFEVNPVGNFVENGGDAFGPNFSPPNPVYLLDGP